MPLHLYYGDEPFLLNQAIKECREKYVNPDFSALCHKILNKPAIHEVLEAVSSVGFAFGQSSLIEIHQFAPLSGAVAEDDEAVLNELKTALSELSDPLKHIAFISTKVDKKYKFPKWLCSDKGPDIEIRECAQLAFYKTDEAVSLILGLAKKQKIDLTPKAAHVLVDSLGVSLQILMNEVEKLAIYTGGKAITPEDVYTLCNHNENTFQMLEAWVQGNNRPQVFEILDEVLLKSHPLPLFSLVQTFLDSHYHQKLLADMGMPPPAIADKLKKHPFKVKKDLEQYARVPTQRFRQLKTLTTQLEWKMKTGQLDARLALEVLLCR